MIKSPEELKQYLLENECVTYRLYLEGVLMVFTPKFKKLILNINDIDEPDYEEYVDIADVHSYIFSSVPDSDSFSGRSDLPVLDNALKANKL